MTLWFLFAFVVRFPSLMINNNNNQMRAIYWISFLFYFFFVFCRHRLKWRSVWKRYVCWSQDVRHVWLIRNVTQILQNWPIWRTIDAEHQTASMCRWRLHNSMGKCATPYHYRSYHWHYLHSILPRNLCGVCVQCSLRHMYCIYKMHQWHPYRGHDDRINSICLFKCSVSLKQSTTHLASVSIFQKAADTI